MTRLLVFPDPPEWNMSLAFPRLYPISWRQRFRAQDAHVLYADEINYQASARYFPYDEVHNSVQEGIRQTIEKILYNPRPAYVFSAVRRIFETRRLDKRFWNRSVASVDHTLLLSCWPCYQNLWRHFLDYFNIAIEGCHVPGVSTAEQGYWVATVWAAFAMNELIALYNPRPCGWFIGQILRALHSSDSPFLEEAAQFPDFGPLYATLVDIGARVQ